MGQRVFKYSKFNFKSRRR